MIRTAATVRGTTRNIEPFGAFYRASAISAPAGIPLAEADIDASKVPPKPSETAGSRDGRTSRRPLKRVVDFLRL